MSSSTEVVVANGLTLTGADVVLATLTRWHPRVDVLVNTRGQQGLVSNAIFTLLGTDSTQSAPCGGGALGRADVPSRVFTTTTPKGVTLEVTGRSGVTPTGTIDVVIIGWDPQFQTSPVQVEAHNAIAMPATSTIAVASNGQSLPQATINVAATAGSPPNGTVLITTDQGPQTVTYTGLTGTTYTGCTGGLGLMTTGNAVSQSQVLFGSINWRPKVDVMAGAPNAAGNLYQLWALAGGMRALVWAGAVADPTVGGFVIQGFEGGATTYELDVLSQGAAGTFFGAVIGQAPAGDTISASTVTFAPGGTASDDVYTSWAALFADYGSFTGPLTVFFDLSASAGTTTIPAGTYAFASRNMVWTSQISNGGQALAGTSECNVNLATNVHLSGLAQLSGGVQLVNIGTTIPIVITAGANFGNFTLTDFAIMRASGGFPVIQYATDGSGTQELNLFLLGFSSLFSPSGGGTSIVQLTGTGFLFLIASPTAFVGANTIGLPTSVQFSSNSCGASIATAQSGVLDTGLIASVTTATGQAQKNTYGFSGANLTDADATILVTASGGNWRILPAATLSAGRNLTLSVTGAQPGDQITVTRLDLTANTYTVKDGAGTTLLVMPASKANFGKFQFTGTAWKLRECGLQ